MTDAPPLAYYFLFTLLTDAHPTPIYVHAACDLAEKQDPDFPAIEARAAHSKYGINAAQEQKYPGELFLIPQVSQFRQVGLNIFQLSFLHHCMVIFEGSVPSISSYPVLFFFFFFYVRLFIVSQVSLNHTRFVYIQSTPFHPPPPSARPAPV